MLRTVLFVLLCSVAALTHAAATILVFGDSVSAGYGLPRGTGWVDLLRARLAQAPHDYNVVNASLTGETTTGGKLRLDALLVRHTPQVVILALGGNDGLRGTNADAISANLTAMIADCRAHRSKVLLVGMRVPPNYGSDYEKKFRTLYAEVAKAQRVPLAPFLFEGFASDRGKFQPDGIHPTVDAQGQMLETVWRQLGPLLAQRRAKR
jgi:acyl-CoA thioesterase-1